MKRAIITVGLGFGDEGKGTVVDALTRHFGAKLVVRYNGGAQAGHNVVTADGRHHTFSQFGSGTLAGADTLLSRYMLVNPLAVLNEHVELAKKIWRWTHLYVDARALVTTPFHVALNRWREAIRGNGRHGSCGKGIGETVQHALNRPQEAITVGDLQLNGVLRTKLELLSAYYTEETHKLKVHGPVSWSIDNLIERYNEFNNLALIVNPKEVAALISREDTLIFEGAQGVLLDELYGFHPYTTWSNTLATNAHALLAEAGYPPDGNVHTVGITRTFLTRHGPGPFPTYAPELTTPFKDVNNQERIGRGAMRYGWLDLPLLRYAARLAGMDSMAVTHTDKELVCEKWRLGVGYTYDGTLVESIPVPSALPNEWRTYDIEEYRAVYEEVSASDLLPRISQELNKPISIISHGPCAEHKTFFGEMNL